MGLRPRAAAIRGDDYQHAVGWYWACEMLADLDIDNVTIEEPSAGSFEDVVVRRRSGTTRYIQVKRLAELRTERAP
jgi:crotonobetainyl-CoA:carnitine CoA-transferase CaiB-like acyl-CoA transferase